MLAQVLLLLLHLPLQQVPQLLAGHGLVPVGVVRTRDPGGGGPHGGAGGAHGTGVGVAGLLLERRACPLAPKGLLLAGGLQLLLRLLLRLGRGRRGRGRGRGRLALAREGVRGSLRLLGHPWGPVDRLGRIACLARFRHGGAGGRGIGVRLRGRPGHLEGRSPWLGPQVGLVVGRGLRGGRAGSAWHLGVGVQGAPARRGRRVRGCRAGPVLRGPKHPRGRTDQSAYGRGPWGQEPLGNAQGSRRGGGGHGQRVGVRAGRGQPAGVDGGPHA